MKWLVFAALLAVAACGKSSDPTATASTDAIPTPARQTGKAPPVDVHFPDPPAAPFQSMSLSARISCLDRSGGLVLIGHRGGPTRDFPANALETLQRTYRAGTHGMEIDVAQSRDGKLYLMHDDTLDRATTGHGAPDSLPWTEVQKLNLRTGRKETDFHPASLDAVLEWAVASHALIELDRKAATSFPAMADAVHKAHAENNVLVVAYTDAQTLEVHKQAPDLAIVATIHSAGQLDGLLRRGVSADRLVAWTGTEKPDPALWKALREKGVASAFGTLGPRGKSLDSDYWADGDGAEYQALAADGLRFLVTDLTDKVSRELAGPLEKGRACGF
jgi:glycerophosphoryl diester phosphodiesterase